MLDKMQRALALVPCIQKVKKEGFFSILKKKQKNRLETDFKSCSLANTHIFVNQVRSFLSNLTNQDI